MLRRASLARSILPVALLPALSACTYIEGLDLGAWRGGWGEAEPVIATVPDPDAPRQTPLPTRHFESVGAEQEVLGDVQILFARHENTFVQIARDFDLGYEELKLANPDVDVWLPGEGTPIFLPTMNVVPALPREGIVLNLPSMRLMYFAEDSANDGRRVTSHPIGIGREGWATPTGSAAVTGKAREPTWYPPASIRAEHAELGDPLPSVVGPGPDNPLGDFALGLSMPGYLIHGTNKPAGVGMRVSHGCIRLYPEDIEALFDRVPSGTPVNIIDEPVLAGWRDGELFLEVHAPLAEDERDMGAQAERVIAAAFQRADLEPVPLDMALITRIVTEQRGIPFPILSREQSIDGYLASARVIENTIESTGEPVVVETAALGATANN
ncbi:MAG: L,D-transpeptidase family protein [Gammaproteobacteria bacterium]|nr:L,D-transpeptidase family protein [Gammaproteobacteria bacterium]